VLREASSSPLVTIFAGRDTSTEALLIMQWRKGGKGTGKDFIFSQKQPFCLNSHLINEGMNFIPSGNKCRKP